MFGNLFISRKIEKVMKKELHPEKFVGKKVKISAEDQEFEGTLIFSYDPDVVLLKLTSGYNLGIEKNKINKITEKKEKAEKKEKFKPKIVKPKTGLPEVAFIVTGGTIASSLDYKTGAVKPLTRPDDIIAVAPKINELAKPIIESPFMVLTENITAKHLKTLALAVEKALNKPNIKGVIILMGTDILHYVAAALAFMFPSPNKPVILTCAQRSIDRGSSDALLNLTCSTYATLSNIAEVLIVSHATSNDNFCFALRATKTRKMHTSRRDTFRPINTKPLATIWENGTLKTYQEYNKREEKKKVKAQPFFEEKTALVKWYPNASPSQLEFFIKQKYKGLVIEATGFGHVAIEGSGSWLPAIKKATKNGIIIAFAPQTLYGRLDPFVYETGRKLKEAGIIYLADMLPETAYIKLAWLLGKEKDKNKVKAAMFENLAHEFNPQLSEKDFLI